VNPVVSLGRQALPVSFVSCCLIVICAVVLDFCEVNFISDLLQPLFSVGQSLILCTGKMQWTKPEIEFVLASFFPDILSLVGYSKDLEQSIDVMWCLCV
jgi:hypothetical protein